MAYDKNASVNIWVGNIGRYNEGNLVGEWFGLPMNRTELWRAINKECKVDRLHEEVMIFDAECSIDGVSIGEHSSIDDCNALAAAIDDLNGYERDAVELYAKNVMGNTDPLRVANVCMDCGSIPYYEYAYNGRSPEESYGLTMVYECNPELAEVLEKWGIEGYFDFEAYGRDTDDYLFDNGYIEAGGDEPDDDWYSALEILEEYNLYAGEDEEEEGIIVAG